MLIPKQTTVPTLVRVKPGALDRMGIYAERLGLMQVVLLFSSDLNESLLGRLIASLRSRNGFSGIQPPGRHRRLAGRLEFAGGPVQPGGGALYRPRA